MTDPNAWCAPLRARAKANVPRWTVHFNGGGRMIDWIQTADIDYALTKARKAFGRFIVSGVGTFDRDFKP